MKRVGRPSLPYKTRHVMINMKDEHYEYMKKGNINMSKEINKYLDARFHLKICPTCYMDIVESLTCHKCGGKSIFCQNPKCTDYDIRVGSSCPTEMYFGKLRPQCTAEEFYKPGTIDPEFG